MISFMVSSSDWSDNSTMVESFKANYGTVRFRLQVISYVGIIRDKNTSLQ